MVDRGYEYPEMTDVDCVSFVTWQSYLLRN